MILIVYREIKGLIVNVIKSCAVLWTDASVFPSYENVWIVFNQSVQNSPLQVFIDRFTFAFDYRWSEEIVKVKISKKYIRANSRVEKLVSRYSKKQYGRSK